jgi:hypothetical protein
MKITLRQNLIASLVAALTLLPALARAQNPPVPTPAEVAGALGFSDSEIEQIKGGEIVSKDLREGSDKELAGVVATFFKRPLAELAEKVRDGKFLETDPAILKLRVWEPEAPAAAQFAEVSLAANEEDETSYFLRASEGSRLNLSAAEVARFRRLNDASAVNAELQAMLQARYEAYRRSGLKGIAPYARSSSKTVSPAEELSLAIQQALPGERLPGHRKALLNYPADPLAGMEHRFYWIKKQVEDRPTFILAHRTSVGMKDAEVLTEEQFYVGHSYNCNFVIAAGFTVEGGTLVFYVNRTFTDQVAGFGSSLRHSIGRKQMLSNVEANLKRIRAQ